MRRTALSLLLLACAAHSGMAQQAPSGEAGTACTATPPVALAAPGGRTDTLYAIAELGHQAPDSARLYAMFLLEEVARQFRFPTPFSIAVWDLPDTPPWDIAVPAIAAEVALVIGADGQLRHLTLSQTSLVPEVDAAFGAALRKALQGEGIPSPSVLGIRKDFTLFVALTLHPPRGMVSPSGRDRQLDTAHLTPAHRRVEQPLVRLELPSAYFSAPVGWDPKRSKPPRFPRKVVVAGQGGDVTMEFVVGRDGRIVRGTVRLIGATVREFAAAVVKSLEDSRYSPGEIGGCPVPVLVRQTFSFRIDRP